MSGARTLRVVLTFKNGDVDSKTVSCSDSTCPMVPSFCRVNCDVETYLSSLSTELSLVESEEKDNNTDDYGDNTDEECDNNMDGSGSESDESYGDCSCTSYRCSGCREIIEKLYNTKAGDPETCYIKIKIKVIDEDHDGYCSEGEEIKRSVSKRKYVFPVPIRLAWGEVVNQRRLISCFAPLTKLKCCCYTYYKIKSYVWLDSSYSGRCDDLQRFLEWD